MNILQQEPIAALATAPGIGAIAVIRVSGQGAIERIERIFHGKPLAQQPSHTVHFGTIRDEIGTIIDEVLISIFRSPTSFTKEDVVEISCHGSDYIIQQLLQLLLQLGIRLAQPGEFTQRAFLNGQFDLVQAEAVADLIAADSEATHRAALTQLRGGFSKQLKDLRQELVELAALVELELDFGEENVEFAKREELRKLVLSIQGVLRPLIESFTVGNAIKNGIPTVIAGKPNAGKSTLLNALLNEERAIVSDIPGTTRDSIEDELFINNIRFRLIDTAGLRYTTDTIEAIGVERTQQKMREATLIIFLFDAGMTTPHELQEALYELQSYKKPYVLVGNKLDTITDTKQKTLQDIVDHDTITWISAFESDHIDILRHRLVECIKTDRQVSTGSAVITNLRHVDHLTQTNTALIRVLEHLDAGTTSDWLAIDLRNALHHLGELTGEITTDDLLATIFSKFCIGK